MSFLRVYVYMNGRLKLLLVPNVFEDAAVLRKVRTIIASAARNSPRNEKIIITLFFTFPWRQFSATRNRRVTTPVEAFTNKTYFAAPLITADEFFKLENVTLLIRSTQNLLKFGLFRVETRFSGLPRISSFMSPIRIFKIGLASSLSLEA